MHNMKVTSSIHNTGAYTFLYTTTTANTTTTDATYTSNYNFRNTVPTICLRKFITKHDIYP